MKHTSREVRSARREAIRKAVADQKQQKKQKQQQSKPSALPRGPKTNTATERKAVSSLLNIDTNVHGTEMLPTPTSPRSPAAVELVELPSPTPSELQSPITPVSATQEFNVSTHVAPEAPAQLGAGGEDTRVATNGAAADGKSVAEHDCAATPAQLPVPKFAPATPEADVDSAAFVDNMSVETDSFRTSDLDTAPKENGSSADTALPSMTDDEFETYMQGLETSSCLSSPNPSAPASGPTTPVLGGSEIVDALFDTPVATEDQGLDQFIDFSATCDDEDASPIAEIVHMKKRVPLCGYRDRRDGSATPLIAPNKRSVLAAYWTVAPDLVVSTQEAYMHSVMLAAASLNHRSMLSGRARQTMAPAMGTTH